MSATPLSKKVQMNAISLGTRLQEFRVTSGLSQQELANLLQVRPVTLLRWENGTSNPSPEQAEKLEQMGFGEIDRTETKHVHTPRLTLNLHKPQELRDGIQKTIKLGEKAYDFDPSSYVINGPENQLPFFETMYRLQEHADLPCLEVEYSRRLSLVASVPDLNFFTAQHALEHPRPNATHWNPNYGSHGWHRYVGRFPPHLVRTLINHFGARKGETICDPFSGSGTTLVESRLLGLRAIGIEICPLSSLISRTKSKFPDSTTSLAAVSRTLIAFYQKRWKEFVGDHDIKLQSHQAILQRSGNSIPAFANHEKWFIPEALLGTSIVVEFAESLSGFERDAVCCALSSCMRSIGNVDVDVVRAEYSKTPRREVDVLKLVQRALSKMITDIDHMLTTHHDLLSQAGDISVLESSVLDVNLPPGSIDHIITSPPYGVESLSYLRTHLLSYRSLQPILKYDPYYFNDKIIGSEFINEDSVDLPHLEVSALSETFIRFFETDLKPDTSKKFLQRKIMMMFFFEDMVKLARLFSTWLRPAGHIAFVVGNKKMGNEIIPTDAIISEIFNAFGLHLDQAINHKLKCNNSNSEVPWQERIIQDEFVMIFTKRM